MAIIGHEFGHIIDPCRCQEHLFQFDRQRPMAESIKSALESGFELSSRQKSELQRLENLRPSHFILALAGLGPQHADALADSTQLKVVSRGIEFKDHPFFDVFECFSEKTPIPTFARDHIDVLARRALLRKLGEGDVMQEQEKQDFLAKFKSDYMARTRNGFCGIDEQSADGEVMADFFGSLVLGRYLTANPPKSDIEKRAAISFFAGVHCRSPDDKKGLSGLRHPPSGFRLNYIYLANQQVRDALGCSGEAPHNCLLKEQPPNRTANPDSTTSKAVQ